MISLSFLLCGFFASSSLAATCWRNSTCSPTTEASFSGPWDAYIYAPDTRNPRPRYILDFDSLKKTSDYNKDAALSLQGNGSAKVFDFGIEVGGVVHLDYKLTGDPVTLGLAFTEAKDYIGYGSDDSNGNFRGPGGVTISHDGAIEATIEAGSGTYVSPTEMLRGGFRYLTVFILTNGTSSFSIEDIQLEIVFQPTWSNLRAYQGYFHSNDDDLTKIWYSGAYTLQTDASPPEAGRVTTSKITQGGWLNNAYLGVGDTLILDGAKRDRWVWIGDMGVAVPSAFYSTGDLESSKNSMQTIFNYQDNSTGALPREGPPDAGLGSDTYHMWAMIGMYNYFLFTGDTDFLYKNWAGYKAAMGFVLGNIESDGIYNQTGAGDWARYINVNNGSEPNMLLYQTLTTGATLSTWASSEFPDDAGLNATWTSQAEDLRTNIYKHFWDDDKGAFFDGWLNKTLYPQDTNSMAVAFGVAKSQDAQRVSKQLTENWTPIGPASPELPGNISPFISSIELQAHFRAGRPDRAVRLMRDSWGWYLHHPNGTASTVIEGYRTDGSWGYRKERGYTDDPSYVSHSHGWSSGPTSSLTEYLVGLKVTGPAGKQWELRPALWVIDEAEAGFTTSMGKFSAKFEVKGDSAHVTWDAPEGTKGWIDLGKVKKWVEGGKGKETVMVKRSCKPLY